MALTYLHGKDSNAYAGGQDVTGVLREISHSATVDTAETSVMGLSDKTYIAGMRDDTVTLGGLFDGSTSRTNEVLISSTANTIGLGVSPSTLNGIVTYCPLGSSRGGPAELINGTVTGYDVSSPAQDVVAASVTVQGSGGKPAKNLGKMLTNGTTAKSSTIAGSGTVAFGSTSAPSTAGGVAHIHVTGFSSGTCTIVLQHTSGVGYSDKATFALTASSSGSSAVRGYRQAITGTMKETWRYAITTMSSTSISFAAAVARY